MGSRRATATPTAQQRIGDLIALAQSAGLAEHGSKEVREIPKQLADIQTQLARGDRGDAREDVEDLRKRIEELARKNKLDPRLAAQMAAQLAQLAGQLR
ncbi:MAG: hypothetical protein HY331_01805 [Chloroflexi bacterium]|nr:hypothetical protein [Chloroflexota bacterium]